MAKWNRQQHNNVKIPLADGMTMTISGEYPTCSECGFAEVGLAQETNYCPNCGAKMDGEGKPFVKCGGCKYLTDNINDDNLRSGFCNREDAGYFFKVSENDFCSFGELK